MRGRGGHGHVGGECSVGPDLVWRVESVMPWTGQRVMSITSCLVASERMRARFVARGCCFRLLFC